MSYGFSFVTGPSAETITIQSNESSPGVLLDDFTVTYSSGSVETRTYSSFPGSLIYVVSAPIYVTETFKNTAQTISVNSGAKSVTVTNKTGASDWEQGAIRILVLGF